MKAEHRHELQTNELAEWLDRAVETLKPYARAIVGLAVALLIILGVYLYVGAAQRRGEAEASTQYIDALQSVTGGSEELQSVVQRYRGTPPAVLAQLVLAETQLNDGTNALYTNKLAARDTLRHAAESFVQADDATRDPMLKSWALYGQARAYESMGELDLARTQYQSLINTYPDSAIIDAARTHLAHLNRQSIKEFYDWFAKQDPRPPAAEKSTGIPGWKPPFDLSEPTTSGDLKFPSATDSKDAQSGTDTSPSITPAGAGASDAKPSTVPSDSAAPANAADTKSQSDAKKPADAKK